MPPQTLESFVDADEAARFLSLTRLASWNLHEHGSYPAILSAMERDASGVFV